MRRNKLIAILAAVTTVTITGTSAMASSAGHATGRFDRPQHGFAPASTVLSERAPKTAGLDPATIQAGKQRLDQATAPDPATGHPMFSGAVGLYAHDGTIVGKHAAGSALRYGDRAGTELPPEQQVPMRTDTIFDMASISKLFTSIAVLQLVERGEVDLDAPLARYLPEFGSQGKETITIKQLLTHTSGLAAEPDPPLWQAYPDIPSRRVAVLTSTPVAAPGTSYEYSDLNLISLGFLVERITGSTLDEVVRNRITEPLHMKDTGYNPPASKMDRIAATEYTESPPRGLIRGQVHDENCWSLGGVSGHAGIFSTADDMAILGQAVLNGGTYRGERILRPQTTRAMLDNYNQAFPDDAHGLGVELDQRWYMGGLSSPETAGHTGFTGTSLVVDPKSRSIAVLLTNKVHPTREWGSINSARHAWASGLADALAVRPKHGNQAWFTGIGDASSATLRTRSMRPRGKEVRVDFDAFVDTEHTDKLTLETSANGEDWHPVPVRASGRDAPDARTDTLSGAGHRQWWHVTAQVPAAQALSLRWRYTTDAKNTGRGVYVDGIRATDRQGVLLDGATEPGALTADGWQPRSR